MKTAPWSPPIRWTGFPGWHWFHCSSDTKSRRTLGQWATFTEEVQSRRHQSLRVFLFLCRYMCDRIHSGCTHGGEATFLGLLLCCRPQGVCIHGPHLPWRRGSEMSAFTSTCRGETVTGETKQQISEACDRPTGQTQPALFLKLSKCPSFLEAGTSTRMPKLRTPPPKWTSFFTLL